MNGYGVCFMVFMVFSNDWFLVHKHVFGFKRVTIFRVRFGWSFPKVGLCLRTKFARRFQ